MRVQFSRRFIKHYDKAPQQIRRALDQRLALFMETPTHSLLHYHSLKGALEGYYSINVTGDWRALFHYIDDTVLFDMLGTHSQLYG